MIENPIKDNLRAVVQCLAAEGRQWLDGVANFHTEYLTRPGPASVAVSDESVRQLETALHANGRIKVREFLQILNIRVGFTALAITKLLLDGFHDCY